MKSVTYLITLLWIAIGIYLGMAGWVGSKALQRTSITKAGTEPGKQSYEFEGLNFANEDELMEFLREQSSSRWFPWMFSIPKDLIPLMAAMAFGFLGGAAALLKRISLDSERISLLQLFSEPLFGSIIGLMFFFLSLVVPSIFTSGSNPIRAETLVGFSLFGGAFSPHAYNWIEGQVKRLFSSTKKTRGSK